MHHYSPTKHVATLRTVNKTRTPAALRKAHPIIIHALSFLEEAKETIAADDILANAKISTKGTQPRPSIEQVFSGCIDQTIKFSGHSVHPSRDWKLFRIDLSVQTITLHFVKHESLIPPILQYPSGCYRQDNYVTPQTAIITITAPPDDTAYPKGFGLFKCSFHTKSANHSTKTHETYRFSSYHRPSDRCQELRLFGCIDIFDEAKPHSRTEVEIKDLS